MEFIYQKNSSRKKKIFDKIAIFALIFAAFLLTACSVSPENNTDDIPLADITATESPTAAPTLEPTEAPVLDPTAEPTTEPTAAPTPEPTTEPTAAPTLEPTVAPSPEPTVEPTPEPTAEPAPEPIPDPITSVDTSNTPDEFTYVLNTNSRKIHHPNCKSVAKIKAENYSTTNKTLEELLDEGYTKCGNCW